MARTKKVQLSFNRGALSPHLDGRLDLYQAGNALRTCRNFVVEREGGVKRRPGTRFIAQAASGIELSHVSFSGTATYYGITELASVSDPPRKYLQLVPSNAAFRRSFPSTTEMGFAARNRTVYDITGTRTEAVTPWANRSSGAPYGLAAGITLLSPGDSLESLDWASMPPPWEDTGPAWSRDRLTKWFDGDSFSTPGSGVDFVEEYGQGFGRVGGTVRTIRGLGVRAAWNGAGWTLTIQPFSDDGSGSGQTGDRRVYMRLAAGNQDPGTVSNADFLVMQGAGQFPSTTIDIPPDSSVRFFVVYTDSGGNEITANGVQVPQQTDTTIDGTGVESASYVTEDAFDRWLYFAATETLQGDWRFEEKLCNEDTLTAAIQRSSDMVAGTEAVARTDTLTGGTAAESNLPIQWAGRVVRTTKTISGLTIGHRYSVTASVRTNTIGGADFSTFTEAGEEFVAQAASTQVTHEVRAGIGKEKRVLNITVTDLGAEPSPEDAFDTETLLYEARVLSAGGSLSAAELEIADNLIVALKAAGVWSKTCYLLPLLGGFSGIFVPLRDRDNAGNATNSNFVSGDYGLATGLDGNGSTKRLIIPRNAGEVGSSNNGGIGAWALDLDPAGTTRTVIGSLNTAETNSYHIALRATGGNFEVFRWGANANLVNTGVAAQVAFYYGQRSSATSRTLYRNGVSIGTNTTSDATSGATNQDLSVLAERGTTTYFHAGRVGCAICTNGALSAGEITSLYEILRDELMTPTGRI